MSARREAQSVMPGLAEPRESGRSVFGPSLTPPPRPINVAAALFMPIPADDPPRSDGNTINIEGGTFNQAHNMAVHQHHHHYPDNTSAPASGSGFQDPIGVLRGWTNGSLWTNHQSISSKRTAKTGRVFLSRAEYRNWRPAPNGVFWASGKPGAGKTYLAAAAFDEINDDVRDNPTDACTVIYLKHNDQWTTWDIVSFIIIDLVESKPLPAALEAIRETLRKQRSMGERPSSSDLIALLHKIVKLYDRCYILIDGLDEMKAGIQVDVIKMIADLEANVLLTSRPLNLVQDKLAKIALKKPVFTTVAAVNEDLKLYIEDTIDRTPTFDSLLDDSFPKEQLITKIQTNADGMFLHAMLQMEALRHCITQEELLGLLDRFPPGLDAMYAETMKRIQGQHPSHASFAKTALLWLVHANGSMTIDDLRCATATVAPDYRVEPKRMLTEGNLLTICCGLVTVDAKTRQARLIHDTAREALGRLLLDHCPKPQVMMATTCLTRLVEFDFHQSSVRGRNELEELFTKGPLLQYAHRASQHHIQKGVEEDSGLISHVEQFVRQCTSFPYLDPFISGGIHGLTALHVAIIFNQQPVVDRLLKEGGDVNEKTDHWLGGISPLTIAVLEGFDDLTQYLLTVPDIHANDGELTPLTCAARWGRDIIVKQLLLHFEGVAKGQGDQGRAGVAMEVNRAGRFGRTALGFAAFGGHAAVVELLLGVEGVDINKGDEDGWPPLSGASQEGHVEVVTLLLRAPGIDVNQASTTGASPLFIASRNGHVEVVKLLLNAPAINVNQAAKYRTSPLLIASQNSQVEVVKLLLSAPGIDVNQASTTGASPLFIASQNGHVEVVKLLLNTHGINVNQAANDGASPLLLASQQGYVEVVRLLLSARGIDVNQPWENRLSPLLMASQNGHVEVVKLLISAPGIDVNQPDDEGDSPLFVASHEGHVEVVKLLLSSPGININLQNIKQVSPLIIASYQGHKDVVKVLLDVPGINITHEDSYGNTALTAASNQGHEEIAQLLSAALDGETAPLDPTSNAASNDTPHSGQLSSIAASPHAPSPAELSSPSPSQPVGTIPNVPEISGGLFQATSSHSPRPASPSLDPPQNATRKRQRELGTQSSSPPTASTSQQDERTPTRPRTGGVSANDEGTSTTHGEAQDSSLDLPSNSEQVGILPPAPVPYLANPPAPPLHQASISHSLTTTSPSPDPAQDEMARKRYRQDTSPLSSPPASPAMDASQDERAPKRPRVGNAG